MPAVPASFIEPLWVQFEALIPPVIDTHPLGCQPRRISDRVVFDKLVAKLVLGGSYVKHADATCSATTIRARRDEWITAGIFEQVEQITLQAYDQVVGLKLGDVSVDGRHAKAPCGGQCAGPSPVDRRKLGIKWSLLTDGGGIPLGCVIDGGNRHDSPLLRPTLERLGRFGFHLPDQMTVHLDSGYDSNKTRELLAELGCAGQISPKGMMVAINHTKRWVVERTNSWHARGFTLLAICTERRANVIHAFLALANAIIIIRRLIRKAWTTHRWEGRPARRP